MQSNNYNSIIATNRKLEDNTPSINQDILNNSYDFIIDELCKLIEDKTEFKRISSKFKNEKLNHVTLFTDPKRFAHLKSRNHYMSFLFECTIGLFMESKSMRFILVEFSESLIKGYLQAYEFSKLSESTRKLKIKEQKRDLQVLFKYNSRGENDDNIKNIEKNISFLAQNKTSLKILPYKVLSERIHIDNKQLSSYIRNTISINKNNLSDKIDKTVIQTSIKNINTTLNFIK